MARALSDATVFGVKPVAGKQVEIGDSRVPGLAIRVSPSGVKSWTLRYRTAEGDQRRLSLGRYPAVTLSQAREMAQQAIGRVAAGADPAKAKQAAKVAAKARKVSTVGSLIDAYLDDAAVGRHRQNGRPKRPTTLKMERYYVDRLVAPRFGALPVGELRRHELQKFLDEIGATAPASARYCRDVIREAFNYGIRRELAVANPAQIVQVSASQSRERVLTDQELHAVWKAITIPMAPTTYVALAFALVTLQRGGEVCGIHAREIDREGALWSIPGSRTKNHRPHLVPLSRLALDILGTAFSNAGCGSAWSGYAFPSPKKGTHSIDRHAITHSMAKITAKIGLSDARPHDFRRTGSTNITGERIGIPRLVVSRVLNQISDTGGAASVTGVYDRNEYLSEKRKALDAWAALLLQIVAGERRPENVVRMRG